MAGLQVRGRVRSATGDPGSAAARVVVTSGGSTVGEAQVEADGGFAVRIPPGEDLVVTVFGKDHRAMRQRLDVSGREAVDLGDIDVPVAEFPPGISGKAWDLHEDRPAASGSATLRHGDVVAGTERIDNDGDFSFEMAGDRLLTAGTYALIVEVPGYKPAERRIEVTDEIISYRVGRIELIAETAD